jgi:flagellar biosynthesis/type III secretory pathway chaperone
VSLPPRAAARPGAGAGEREALAAFLLVLEAEERALVSGDAEAIDAATREKSGWLARLAALAADPSPPSELLELRRRAREANERNGRLVAVRLARLRQRLEALGAAPAAGAAYGADGLSRAPLAAPGSRRSVV